MGTFENFQIFQPFLFIAIKLQLVDLLVLARNLDDFPHTHHFGEGGMEEITKQ